MHSISNVSTKILPRAQLDAIWKEALRKYFKDFIALCWPEIFAKIDWGRGYTFLEQELFATLGNNVNNKNIADKLIKVFLHNGQEFWVIIHIEVQAHKEINFSERVYIYRYRIFDIYKKNIATLAILIDSQTSWRPDTYKQEFFGTSLVLRYPILKIIDYRTKKSELSKSANPFALIILAQLAAIESGNNQDSRLLNRFKLTKLLFKHGWAKNNIRDMLNFLGGILILSQEYMLKYVLKVKTKLLQGAEMDDISFMSDIGMMCLERGMQQGMQQGMQHGEMDLLTKLLISKFKEVPEQYAKKLQTANIKMLEEWGINLLNAVSIEEVFNS